jgi:hypothetical protein
LHHAFSSQFSFCTQREESTPLLLDDVIVVEVVATGVVVAVVVVDAAVVDAPVCEVVGEFVVAAAVVDEDAPPPPTSLTSAQFVKTSLQHWRSPMVAPQLSGLPLFHVQNEPQ